MATVALLIPLGTLLESTKFLSRVEQSFVNQDVRVCPACPASFARVIITRGDYDSLFHGKSPLDAAVLADLVDAVSAANPAAVLIDIDTSDSSFAPLRAKSVKWPKVVLGLAEPSIRVQKIRFGWMASSANKVPSLRMKAWLRYQKIRTDTFAAIHAL